jgi:peptide/nickel transport system permease protein
MTLFIIRRILQAIAFIFLAILLVYTVVVWLMPTGPKASYELSLSQVRYWNELIKEEPEAAEFPGYEIARNAVEDLETSYKLDKPWPLSFFLWLFDPDDTTQVTREFETIPIGIDLGIGEWRLKGAGMLTGDFGTTKVIMRGTQVGALLSTKLGYSAILIGLTLVLAFLVAVPIGVIGAIRNHTTEAHALTFITLSFRSIPPFALGLVLVLVMGIVPYQLHHTQGWTWMPYLPINSIYDEGQEGNWVNRIYHLALPVFTLTVLQVPSIARYVRATFLDVLGQDYVRTARAKGLSRGRVLYRHALRNALIPLITLVGLAIPGVFSMAIIIEQVFSYPGIGMLYYGALGGTFRTASTFNLQDFNVIPPPVGGPLDNTLVLAITAMLIIVVALSNTIADILYVVVDPRVDYK